jgi:hypothetical protein
LKLEQNFDIIYNQRFKQMILNQMRASLTLIGIYYIMIFQCTVEPVFSKQIQKKNNNAEEHASASLMHHGLVS